MSKKYFKYLLKTFTSVFVVFAVVAAFVFVLIPLMASTISLVEDIDYISITSSSFIVLIFVLIIPHLIHKRYYLKNSSDIYLSLPISRKQAFLTELVFGLGGVLAINTVLYLVGAFVTVGFALAFEKQLTSSLGNIFLAYVPFLFVEVVLYLVSVTATSLANSKKEASSITVMLLAIPSLINEVIVLIFNQSIEQLPDWFRTMLSAPTCYYHLISSYQSNLYFESYGETIVVILLNTLAWVGMCVFALTQFKKLKSEHLGTAIMEKFGALNMFVVLSFLGYIFLGFFLGMIMDSPGNLLSNLLFTVFLIVLIGSIIIYWIAIFSMRKKIKFLKEDLIRFAISIVPSQIFGIIIYFACFR